MKKRIVCVLLTLIMLVGMLPLSASAAGYTISERAITVLKQMQYYSRTCTQYGTEWRNGYGTICSKTGDHATHTITEGEADKALRTKLVELEKAVNAAGFSLNQNQFDALVIFTYDCGTSWLSGTGVMRSAVTSGLTGNAFLNAIGQTVGYGSDSSVWKDSKVNRRMIEANMYLNGAYSNIAPSNYSYVDYNANGGVMAEGSNGTYRQYFDASLKATPAPVPTLKNKVFLGWYDGDTWVSKLTKDQRGRSLTAKWQDQGASYKNATYVYNWLSLDMLASTAIYDKPNGTAIGIQYDKNVLLDRDYIASNGARWGRLQNGKGWVLISGNSDAAKFDIDVTVTVTNSFVRSRVNASVSSDQNGSYSYGDKLRIVDTANGSGFLWGQVADKDGKAIGWVALMYTDWNEVKDDPAANNTTSEIVAKAVINCQGYLNVRSEAGTDNAIVGALADGDHVDIYEIKFVNGHKWGRTTEGWILLTYAQVTMLDTNLNLSTSEDVLAYTFTGKLKKALNAHADASHSAETVGKELAKGTLVAMSMVKNDENGKIWGFNGTGWIQLENVKLDVAKYVVVSDSVTVRTNPSTASTGLDKVVKGVELDITDISVVDATIWGYSEQYQGWINLASKYVQRSNAPVIENVESTVSTGLVATVINTASVKVRNTGAIYGTQLGTLANGTTVQVWQANEDGSWFKLDTNQNGVYDYAADGWASAKYLDVYEGTIGGEEDDKDSATGNGNAAGTNGVETGMGIVANTYTGVNVRQGPGTGYATNGKILTGTAIEITEVSTTATAKWGRTTQGWVCMDYVTMVSNYPIGDAAAPENDPNAGQNVGGYTSNTEGNTTTVSTPAIYAGTVIGNAVPVLKTADADAISIGTLNAGENITIQELLEVTTKEVVTQGTVVDGNATTETTTTITDVSYWARVNGGWVKDPAANLKLYDLEETTYTVVDYAEINVRDGASTNANIIGTLDKGIQVTITRLEITDDKVWGFAEDVGTNGGWVRLDNLAQGAITVATQNDTTTTAPTTPPVVLGNGSDVGGYVTNASGYRYTGKVINANEVNVRATPSTAAAITTTLKYGAGLVVYETTIADNMAWGRCDAGWVYLYYVDLTPVVNGAVDARVVYNDNTIIYTDVNQSGIAGTYARMSVIDILEIVGDMARTELGWVKTSDLL